MSFLQNLVDPHGVGLVVATIVVAVTAFLWSWKVAFVTNNDILGVSMAAMASFGVMASYYTFRVFNRPSGVLSSDDMTDMAGTALTLTLLAAITAATLCVAVVWMLGSMKFALSVAWRMPMATSTMTVLAAVCSLGLDYYALHRTYADGGESEFGFAQSLPLWWHLVALGLVVFGVIVTLVSFIMTGMRMPAVRARWSDRLTRVLEGLAYNGWSHMPYAMPFLPYTSTRWFRNPRVDDEDEAEDEEDF